VVAEGDSVTLTVAAAEPVDGGSITYEWFKAPTAADVGTSVGTGGTYTFTFTPPSAYYYAIVTNTVASGRKATAKSAVVGIIDAASIVLPDEWVEKVTIVVTAAPVYGFKLPNGKTFGGYDQIKFDFRMDTDSPNKNGRMRVWGGYASTNWSDPANNPVGQDMGNSAPSVGGAGRLLNALTLDTYTTSWTTQTVTLTNFAGAAAAGSAEIMAQTGVILAAFGPIANNDGSGGTRIYYIKNIVLSDSTGTNEDVKALHPDHPLFLGGDGGLTYVRQAATDSVSRTLYDWVDDVHMVNTSVPLYGFKLPAGKTFGDYTKIKINMKTAATQGGRLRVWGNYPETVYDPSAASQGALMQNASPGGLLIGSSDGGSTFGDTWTVYERTFNARDAADTATAIKAATGVIILGIGPVPGAGASDTKDYKVMGITLENDDGTLVVKALRPDSSLLWAGAGTGAFVTQSGSDQLTRTLSIIDFNDF